MARSLSSRLRKATTLNPGIWPIPTPEFRLAAFKAGHFVELCREDQQPVHALSNLLARDRLFTIRLQGMWCKEDTASVLRCRTVDLDGRGESGLAGG